METTNEVRVGLPSKIRDSIVNRPFRLNSLQEQIIQTFGPDRAAEEGSRFVAVNPTPGTVIATTTSITAFTVASPIMAVVNNNAIDSGINITLDYLRLIQGQVPTSASTWHWLMQKDSVARYSSAGSTITPKNVSTGAPNQSGSAGIYFGALVAAAAGVNARYTHRSVGRSVIPVINDETLFKFGSPSHDGAGSLGGTVALRIPIPCGPEVIKPGETWLLYGWAGANAAAPSWEFELGYIER